MDAGYHRARAPLLRPGYSAQDNDDDEHDARSASREGGCWQTLMIWTVLLASSALVVLALDVHGVRTTWMQYRASWSGHRASEPLQLVSELNVLAAKYHFPRGFSLADLSTTSEQELSILIVDQELSPFDAAALRAVRQRAVAVYGNGASPDQPENFLTEDSPSARAPNTPDVDPAADTSAAPNSRKPTGVPVQTEQRSQPGTKPEPQPQSQPHQSPHQSHPKQSQPQWKPPSKPLRIALGPVGNESCAGDGKELYLHCVGDQHIEVRHASYGDVMRTGSCVPSLDCVKNVTVDVRSLCQGHGSCRIPVSWTQLTLSLKGDPCPGHPKALGVIFECVPKGEPSYVGKVTVPLSQFVSCPNGTGIDVVRSKVGDTDVTQAVQQTCNGKNRCRIPAAKVAAKGTDVKAMFASKVHLEYRCQPFSEVCHPACAFRCNSSVNLPMGVPDDGKVRTVILSVAFGYGTHVWCMFFNSLRDSGYRGHVVIGTQQKEMDDPYIKKAISTGPFTVDMVIFNVSKTYSTDSELRKDGTICQVCGTDTPHVKRFTWYTDIIKQPKFKDAYFLLTDFRDVVFQRDPFSKDVGFPMPPGVELYFFTESAAFTLSTQWFNNLLMNGDWGANRSLWKDEPIINSGNVMGTQKGVLTYAATIVRLARQYSNTTDQPLTNWAYYSGQLSPPHTDMKVRVWGSGYGACNVVGLGEREPGPNRVTEASTDCEGLVRNVNGALSPQVHQFDRFQWLSDTYMERRYTRFRCDIPYTELPQDLRDPCLCASRAG